MSLIDPTDRLVYMGNDFFKGSTLCLTVNSSGQYDLNAFWKALITDQTGANLLTQNLINVIVANNALT
jgi:hypothetical protein